MPYLITKMQYPSHQQFVIVKIWVKTRDKYPEREDLAVQLCAPVTTNENGIVVMAIYEVKEGQLEKALTYWSSFLYEYISVEGYEYTIRVWSTFEEALAIAGIEAPE